MSETTEGIETTRRAALKPSEIRACLDVLSSTAIELYGENLRDPEVQFKLAALGENVMFQRVFYYAQRAALEFALSQVESKLTGVRR